MCTNSKETRWKHNNEPHIDLLRRPWTSYEGDEEANDVHAGGGYELETDGRDISWSV